MTYLLDTNAISDLMRDEPNVDRRVASLGPTDVLVTSVICAAEVWHGVGRLPAGRRRDGFRARATRVISPLRIEPVPAAAGDPDVRVKLTCTLAGRVVGDNDLWIAATALILSATLVTRDADFGCVPGLLVEDWSR